MRNLTKKLSTLFVALCVASTFSAQGQEKLSKAELSQQIEQLSQKLDEIKAEVADDSKPVNYKPTIFGTVAATYNMSLQDGVSRFNVRNSRFGVKGQSSNHLSYALQIDFNNQGSISVLDSYIGYKIDNVEFKLGQQPIHLTTDFDRGPSSNLFTTRTFAAIYSTSYYLIGSDNSQAVKSFGSRDIGAYLTYKFKSDVPVSLSAGLFNGTGINTPVWDKRLSYTGRMTVGSNEGLFGGVSFYGGTTPNDESVNIYSGELSYNTKKFFAESIFQRRAFGEGGNKHKMDMMVVQGYYNIFTPKSKVFKAVSPTLRWDYGDNIGYLTMANENGGSNTLDRIELLDMHRLSATINFALIGDKFRSRLCVGYEKIFVNRVPADIDYNTTLHDKITVGLISAF